MLTVDMVRAVPPWLLDRLDVLLEVQSLEDALTLIERQHGSAAELEDARQRVQRVRGVVLEQLRGLLAVQTETVH
jgi:hypothetical protein